MAKLFLFLIEETLIVDLTSRDPITDTLPDLLTTGAITTEGAVIL